MSPSATSTNGWAGGSQRHFPTVMILWYLSFKSLYGDSTTSLGILFQCLAIPSMSKCFVIPSLNLSWHNLVGWRDSAALLGMAAPGVASESWAVCLRNFLIFPYQSDRTVLRPSGAVVSAHSSVVCLCFFLADVNECTTENGGCHDRCCNTIGSYHCKCPAGQKLGEDGKSCAGNALCHVSLLLRNQQA